MCFASTLRECKGHQNMSSLDKMMRDRVDFRPENEDLHALAWTYLTMDLLRRKKNGRVKSRALPYLAGALQGLIPASGFPKLKTSSLPSRYRIFLLKLLINTIVDEMDESDDTRRCRLQETRLPIKRKHSRAIFAARHSSVQSTSLDTV